MSIIVTDTGFAPDDTPYVIVDLADLPEAPAAQAVTLGPTDKAAAIADRLADLKLIRVTFPAFNDGRGFTIGHDLRLLGFTGRLRAAGHVLADQYAMARRAGFDEVEISEEIAARQPENQWRFRADWRAHDHRSRLFA